MKNIKIYTTHTSGKNSFEISNEIFIPIGKNIDDFKTVPLDNKKYCELCTQYYAWKNVDADYYGFTHYRRFFSFSDAKQKTNKWNVVLCDYLNEKSAADFGFYDCEKIAEEVERYDIMSIIPVNLQKVGFKSVYEQYKLGQKLHIEDLDITADIVKELYPNIYSSLQSYLKGTVLYSCNMFIMKKSLFFGYCEFLFSVLAEFEKRKSVDAYSVEGKRTLGHLGERLFGAYYTYLKTHAKISYCDKQLIMFQHTEKDEKLFPAFPENNVGVVFAANEYYSPFTSATIQSVIDHSRDNNNYDIIILSKDMPEKCKNMFSRQIAGKTNFSIRFYDVGSLFFGYNLFERPTISVETYYRLAVPEILSGYGKIVYLDSDLIVKTDIADLFATELGDNLLAGVIDVANSGCINGFDPKYADYYNIHLKMQNACSMINMGVIVMNCKLFRKKYNTQYLLEFAQQGNFKFQDQDLLNIVCERKIKYLNPEWNFFADPINSYRGQIETFAPAAQYTAYLKAKENIKILHFAGNEKPWKYATCDYEYADEFWTEFIKTPFYGAFILKHKIYDKKISEKTHKKNLLRRLADLLLPKGTRRREFIKNYYHKIKNKIC